MFCFDRFLFEMAPIVSIGSFESRLSLLKEEKHLKVLEENKVGSQTLCTVLLHPFKDNFISSRYP